MINRAFSRDLEVWLIASALVLALVGVSMIYSATQSRAQLLGGLYIRQMVWVVVGLIALAVVAAIPYRYLEAFAYPLYAISIALLIGVLFAPGSSRAHRWFRFGPVLFQPSEIAKITTAFALAKTLATRKVPFRSLLDLAVPIGIVALPLGLVLIEPDLGTSLAFLVLLFAVLFWDGLSPLYLFFLVAPLLSVAFALSNSLVLWAGLPFRAASNWMTEAPAGHSTSSLASSQALRQPCSIPPTLQLGTLCTWMNSVAMPYRTAPTLPAFCCSVMVRPRSQCPSSDSLPAVSIWAKPESLV